MSGVSQFDQREPGAGLAGIGLLFCFEDLLRQLGYPAFDMHHDFVCVAHIAELAVVGRGSADGLKEGVGKESMALVAFKGFFAPVQRPSRR